MSDRLLGQIYWGVRFRRRKTTELSKIDFLKKIVFFENLSDRQIRILSNFLHERKYEENEYLFEVNHPGAALFIIARGEVTVEAANNLGTSEILADIKPGDFLGEMALLDDSPRSASARATKPTIAYALSRAELKKLAKEDPDISTEIFRSLAWVIAERLKATNRFVGAQKKVA